MILDFFNLVVPCAIVFITNKFLFSWGSRESIKGNSSSLEFFYLLLFPYALVLISAVTFLLASWVSSTYFSRATNQYLGTCLTLLTLAGVICSVIHAEWKFQRERYKEKLSDIRFLRKFLYLFFVSAAWIPLFWGTYSFTFSFVQRIYLERQEKFKRQLSQYKSNSVAEPERAVHALKDGKIIFYNCPRENAPLDKPKGAAISMEQSLLAEIEHSAYDFCGNHNKGLHAYLIFRISKVGDDDIWYFNENGTSYYLQMGYKPEPLFFFRDQIEALRSKLSSPPLPVRTR